MDYQLYLGDCLEVMQQFEKQSVDLILADLPYGTTHAEWDSIIPLDKLWVQYKRLVKGAVVLTAKYPFTPILAVSNIEWLRYELIWEKSNGGEFLNANRKPLPRHENILIFYKALPVYNPQMTTGKPYTVTRHGVGITTKDLSVIGWTTENQGERYPISVLYFKNDKGLHPTQKPVALLEYLIKTYSNEGDLVLDNTMGSGSTGEAALRTKRRFIGIERDENYFQIAKQRLENLVELPEGQVVKVKNKEQDISLDLW